MELDLPTIVNLVVALCIAYALVSLAARAWRLLRRRLPPLERVARTVEAAASPRALARRKIYTRVWVYRAPDGGRLTDRRTTQDGAELALYTDAYARSLHPECTLVAAQDYTEWQ